MKNFAAKKQKLQIIQAWSLQGTVRNARRWIKLSDAEVLFCCDRFLAESFRLKVLAGTKEALLENFPSLKAHLSPIIHETPAFLNKR